MNTAVTFEPDTTPSRTSQSLALAQACTALWVATLSLMTAFMQTNAPAHRLLIARKIAKNLGMLHEQPCFTTDCRQIFSKLSDHWSAKAVQLAQQDHPHGGIGLLRPALAYFG